KELNPLSAKKAVKAAFVGARTVKGPLPLKTFTKSPSALERAATKVESSGVSNANSTMFFSIGGVGVGLLSSSLLQEVINNETHNNTSKESLVFILSIFNN